VIAAGENASCISAGVWDRSLTVTARYAVAAAGR
jgi:hypothetical protein